MLPVMMITGSRGFIGTAIIEKFAPYFRIFAFDNKSSKEFLGDNVFSKEMDLTQDVSVNDAMDFIQRTDPQVNIASVIHLAAYYDFSGEPSDLYDKVTVQGTRRLLSALKKFAHVEQFLFSSTQLVHAPCSAGEKNNEQWPLDPKWDYPKSKVETEALIRNIHGQIPSVILRIAGVYNDQCHSIPISHQIQRIYEKRLTGHVFPGDIAHGQPFVHLDDLVEAIWLTVQHRKELSSEEIILIGEPETYSYDMLQKELARLIHGAPHWETIQIPKVVAKTGAWVQDKIPGIEEPFIKPWMIDLADDHCQLDISKAQRVLGWTPQRRLIEALPKMVETLKRDPQRWYQLHHLKISSIPEAAHA
ncbi:MAG: NAD(P)-dependent oxidoreductase [Candidatus Omnitrophica bacterium]|nr:NAD(P)-dependent oxidoreductase [Candidatus Omnitrophota bacterium]